MMIDAVMYGMIPSDEDGELAERAAREQVEEAERAALVSAWSCSCLTGREVDAGHGDVGAEAVQDDHQEGEEDLAPEVGDLEDVLQAREHAELLGVGCDRGEVSGW